MKRLDVTKSLIELLQSSELTEDDLILLIKTLKKHPLPPDSPSLQDLIVPLTQPPYPPRTRIRALSTLYSLIEDTQSSTIQVLDELL